MKKIEEINRFDLPTLRAAGLLWRVIVKSHLSWLRDELPEDFYQHCALVLWRWQGETDPLPFKEFCRDVTREFRALAASYGWHRKHEGGWSRIAQWKGWMGKPSETRPAFLTLPYAQRSKIKGKAYKFTKDDLLIQLKWLGQTLGRAPTMDVVRIASKAGLCAPTGSFERAFGSYSNALAAAGYKPDVNIKKPTEKERIIGQLQRLAKQLKRTPTLRDIEAACACRKCVSHETCRRVFGTMNFALEAAGLRINKRGHSEYSKDDLLKQFLELSERLNKIPTAGDIKAASKSGECASYSTFIAHFGKYSVLCEEGEARKIVSSLLLT